MEAIRGFFEILPIFLAMWAAIACAMSYKRERRSANKIVFAIATVCSMLLIVAQTSWWVSLIIEGTGQGTAFADRLWAAFNSLSMLSYIALARSHGPSTNEDTTT